MSFRREIAQKIIAIIIIIIMTFADIAIIGINAISYAIDMTVTNSGNVQFSAYFVNDNNQELTTVDSNINSNDLKVYIEVSVKNEGYFNGQISLEDTSFKFKEDATRKNEFVKEIDEKTIKLNQINAGVTAKIEVGIEYVNLEKIEIQSLSKDNKINLTGVYKNSKKDLDINGTTSVKINWKSPEELNAKIGAKVLTNKIYEIEENKKRIVQVLVESKLENDLYPIKNTNIKLTVPEGVESIKVHSKSTDATNGNTEFNENNYEYNSETGIVEVKIQNTESEGQISWIKDRKDSLVVTYIYPENISIQKQEVNVESVITTYDERNLSANCKTIIDEEIDGILVSNINLDEYEIYKGKLYTGEERFYTTSTIIDVNYALMDKIEIKEKEAVFCIEDEIKQANIEYVQSRISKAEFDKILGQDGYITILDQDGNTISNINKDSIVDDNGYININYDSGVKSIMITTSKPQIEETLSIYHRKVILNKNYSREQINVISGIKEEIINSNGSTNIKTIKLKDTESKANIDINTDTLSAIKENKNIEIIAILETNDESKDLFKNPSVDIIFPKEIKQVNISSAKALYRNGLKVANCEKIKNEDGNTILHIDFEGEQEKYNNEILNGLEIHIYAELILDKLTPKKTTEFIMNYTNENGSKDIYQVRKQLNIESEEGLVLYNSLSDYNKKDEKVEIVNEEETTLNVDINSKAKTAKIETVLINNYDENITEDVVVIGKIPVKNDENTFNTKINNLTVKDKNAEVFYSTDVDAKSDDKSWTKESSNAKSYKIVFDSVDSGEVIGISYDMTIPSKLSYNERGVLTTAVNYSYNEEDLNNSSNIVFETETATVKTSSKGVTTKTNSGLEINIVTISGNKALNDGDDIFNGETVTYAVSVENNTGKDLNGIDIKLTQNNGVMFELVEKQVYNPAKYDGDGYGMEHYWEETDSNIKEFKDINIPNGETISLDEYQVVVKKDNTTEFYGDISITSDDNTLNENITTIKNNIKDAELKLTFVPKHSEEYTWYRKHIEYLNLKIQNTTESELKDIDVQIVLSKELSCDEIEQYIDLGVDGNIQVKSKEVNSLGETIITLKISSILQASTVEVEIIPYVKDFEEETKTTKFYATATSSNKNTYTSNVVEKVLYYGEEESNLELTQIAKVNGKIIDENTLLKNGDKAEFYITINNLKDKEVELSLTDYIYEYWKDINIKLIKNNAEEDITNQIKDSNLNYSCKIDAKSQIKIAINAIFDNTKINDDYATNTINIADLSYFDTYSDKIQIKALRPDDGNLNITVVQTANPQDKSTISDGQEVEYKVNIKNTCNYDRKINISDSFNTTLKDIKVLINDNDVTSKYLSDNNLQINNYVIKGNTELNIIIKAKIDLSEYTLKTVSNVVLIESDYPDYSSNIITYYTPEISQDDSSDKDEEEQNNSYVIKGMAWLDSNENGKRENDEQRIKDLEVKAINTETKEVLATSAITKEDGSYELNLPKGKYIIVFMYNNDDYYITTYHVDNVDEDVNSDAISKQLTIDSQTGIYGATDEINLTSNKENIDIGLVNRTKFDFKLDKYVSKVVVTNKGGTKTYNLDKTNLGKVEIDSKYLSNSTVLVEYIIKVTNVGDIAGSVEKIVDNMPSDMTYSSSLNADWYLSEKNLYNESLADKELNKGESVEIKLILTKEMAESNTGLFNNTASIEALKNYNNAEDINKDNNKGSADLIISVKTGTALRFSLLVISLTISLMAIAYYVVKKYNYWNF